MAAQDLGLHTCGLETTHITGMRNSNGILISDNEGISSGRTVMNKHADAQAGAREFGGRHAEKSQGRCIKTGSRTLS